MKFLSYEENNPLTGRSPSSCPGRTSWPPQHLELPEGLPRGQDREHAQARDDARLLPQQQKYE